MGAPEWMDSAYTYVAKHHDKVSPKIEFKGYSFHFSVDNLFGKDVQANNGSMRKFEISEQGDEENPDVVCEFALRVPFSEALWSWLGAFAGDNVWVRFEPGVPEEAEGSDDDGPSISDDDEDEGDDPETIPDSGDDELDAPEELEHEHHGKSGPSNLVAFHQDVVQAEQRKRGRPRKAPVDPLTVNSIDAAF